MFNFTGSARRPRQVNLSGRKSTPTTPTSSSLRNKPAPSSSVQNAQKERAAREAERKRLKATETIQRIWRGRKVAEKVRNEWRSEWDQLSSASTENDTITARMSLFLGFMDTRRKKGQRKWSKVDLMRLDTMVLLTRTLISRDGALDTSEIRVRFLRVKFGKLLVDAVSIGAVEGELLGQSLGVLSLLAWKHPELVDEEYYTALSNATASIDSNFRYSTELAEAVVSPLKPITDRDNSHVDTAYKAFSSRYLVTPNLISLLGERSAKELVAAVDVQKVAMSFNVEMDTDSMLWLLAHVIYLSRHGKEAVDTTDENSPKLSAQNEQYINFLSMLLSSVANEVSQRIDIEDVTMEGQEESKDDGQSSKKLCIKKEPLPIFVKQQIESLVQQSSISSLLTSTISTDGNAKVLAGFALTLILVFTARRTDMRFWLCVALTADGVSAVKYVWNAVKQCQLFALIKGDAASAVDYLKYPPVLRVGSSAKSVEDQWNLILLFLEMYSFVLVTGDDHEFLQGTGRQLPLSEASELSVFLKNLSFAMFWWNGHIVGEDKTKDSGGEVFSKTQDTGRAWELDYFRNMVTDVVKAIYTRE
jgi:ubiquitin-protein ligase E3 C